MAILVTGAGGFIGQTLVRRLLASGHEVIALDRHLVSQTEHSRLVSVEGDLTDEACLIAAFDHNPHAVVHLAAVPGGAAEADPDLSFAVNVVGAQALMRHASKAANRPRFVFASTIAVLGERLPPEGVDDATPLRPRLIYGVHKLMTEVALAGLSRRGELDGVGLRLPGVVARPPQPSGLKSAFLSDVFHALRAHKPITLPVSPTAACWLMSAEQCARCFEQALDLDTSRLPENRIVTLPALSVRVQDLVDAIAAETGAHRTSVTYAPDPALEAAFGAYPPLDAGAATRAGFSHDGSLQALVRTALKHAAEASGQP